MTGQRKTWEDELIAAGREVASGAAYKCPNCGEPRHAFALFDDANGDWYCGTCSPSAPKPGPPDLTWDDVRGVRSVFLASSDWTQLADVPEETRAKWQPLRQRARDITATGSVLDAMDKLRALQAEAADL